MEWAPSGLEILTYGTSKIVIIFSSLGSMTPLPLTYRTNFNWNANKATLYDQAHPNIRGREDIAIM